MSGGKRGKASGAARAARTIGAARGGKGGGVDGRAGCSVGLREIEGRVSAAAASGALAGLSRRAGRDGSRDRGSRRAGLRPALALPPLPLGVLALVASAVAEVLEVALV